MVSQDNMHLSQLDAVIPPRAELESTGGAVGGMPSSERKLSPNSSLSLGGGGGDREKWQFHGVQA